MTDTTAVKPGSKECPRKSTRFVNKRHEAVPVAWVLFDVEGVVCAITTKHTDHVETNWTPLYAHPPQPSETVADTDAIAKAIAFSGEIKERRGWDDLLPETRKLYRDKATAALRALKGDE